MKTDYRTTTFWVAIIALLAINGVLAYKLVLGIGQNNLETAGRPKNAPNNSPEHDQRHDQATGPKSRHGSEPESKPNDESNDRHEGPKKVIIERLDLDTTQQQKYDALVEDHRKQTRQITNQINQASGKLYSTLATAHISKDQEEILMAEIGTLQIKKAAINLVHFKDIKALCRPDQLGAFADLAHDFSTLFSPPRPRPKPNK